MKKVLVIEDNEDDVFLIKESVKDIQLDDFDIVYYLDSEKVINYLEKKQKVDFILLDINLPKINGLDILHFLKSTSYKNTPVCVFTTSDWREDIDKAYEFGCNSYVVKPLELKDFKIAIKKIFEYWIKVSKLPKIN